MIKASTDHSIGLTHLMAWDDNCRLVAAFAYDPATVYADLSRLCQLLLAA